MAKSSSENENLQSNRPLIVFVHLGTNPAPTLNWYAELLKQASEDFEIVLITDHPVMHTDFPGSVLIYDRKIDQIGFGRFARKNRAYAEIAGGYWLYTMERLFVLQILSSYYSSTRPVIHLESDNLGLFNREIIEWCLKRIKKTSVVRYSKNAGIASILISPNISLLQADLSVLNKYLQQNVYIQSDMKLLGEALNKNIFDELPSVANADWKISGSENEYVVFDGAAIGQYLFGLDPIHTENQQISGHLNEHFSLPLQSVNWQLDYNSAFPVRFIFENCTYYPLNIHIHSKLLLNRPTINNEIWNRFINEANGLVVRSKGPIVENHIHSKKLTLKNRIRMKIRRIISGKSSNLGT